MVQENNREEITVSDGLQLGRSSIDQTEARTVEDEVSQLKNQNAEVSSLPKVYTYSGTSLIQTLWDQH